MRLYLVQHGEAVPKAEDPARPLTARGRDDVARVAAFAQRAGVQVSQIRHSGKLRAEETAELLAVYLSPELGVVSQSGLAPGDDVMPLADGLHHETQPLMLVGHLPFMERLASLLIAGNSEQPTVKFQPGGIVCLKQDLPSQTWRVRWLLTPDLIP